ncbi:MAG: radical SAM protein [archaeon]
MTKLVLAHVWNPSIYPPLGLGYIASYLKKYGIDSEIKIIGNEAKQALKEILREKPDLVGFTASSPAYHVAEWVAGKLKEETNVPVILGGAHITPIPETLSKNFDLAVLGEGEQTFLELMKLVEKGEDFSEKNLKKINGLAFHSKKEVKKTLPRKLITPLDEIPFPARELFGMEKYLKPQDILCTHESIRGTSMLSSRGCPYRCIYCQASTHWNFLRMNSAEYVANETKHLHEKYKVEGIAVVDDLFISNKDRLRGIIKKLKEHGILGEIRFLVDGRANLIDNETLKLLKKLNVVNVTLGIESGSERVLNYLKKGTVTVKQNIEAINKINAYGMGVYGQFMIGSPTETREEMLQTLEFIKNPGIKTAHISITTPLPGTELWDYCSEKGLIDLKNMDWSKFDMDPKRIENSFYVNEKVPFEEFRKIYDKCWQESMTKHLSQSSFFSKDNLIKGLRKPLFSLKLVINLLKRKLSG